MIWINDILLPSKGRVLTVREIEIGVERRALSGRLVSDITAIKKIFTLNYAFLTNQLLEILATLYSTPGVKILKIQQEDGTIKTYNIKIKPFARGRNLVARKWFWENVTVELEEI